LAATEPKTEVRASPVSVRALIALAVVAIAVYGLDQFSKFLIVTHLTEGQLVHVLGVVLQFHFVKNSGAAFSIARRIRSVGWAVLFGMLLGGTTGNLTDRLFREPGFGVGHVIDFIQVYGFPAIFNIADSFIVASMGLFIILTVRGIGLDGTRSSSTGSEPDVASGADAQPSTPADGK
jgi:signal peptidase II